MKKLIVALSILLTLAVTSFSQSGVGGIKGFVASGFRNGSAIKAKVELTVIENHSKTKDGASATTENGYYDLTVSFGYYILTISAEGYNTYTTKVYIPSSSSLEWATILENKAMKTKQPRK